MPLKIGESNTSLPEDQRSTDVGNKRHRFNDLFNAATVAGTLIMALVAGEGDAHADQTSSRSTNGVTSVSGKGSNIPDAIERATDALRKAHPGVSTDQVKIMSHKKTSDGKHIITYTYKNPSKKKPTERPTQPGNAVPGGKTQGPNLTNTSSFHPPANFNQTERDRAIKSAGELLRRHPNLQGNPIVMTKGKNMLGIRKKLTKMMLAKGFRAAVVQIEPVAPKKFVGVAIGLKKQATKPQPRPKPQPINVPNIPGANVLTTRAEKIAAMKIMEYLKGKGYDVSRLPANQKAVIAKSSVWIKGEAMKKATQILKSQGFIYNSIEYGTSEGQKVNNQYIVIVVGVKKEAKKSERQFDWKKPRTIYQLKKASMKNLKAIIERYVKMKGEVGRKIKFTITVSKNGTVNKINWENVNDASLQRKLARVINRWHFKKSQENIRKFPVSIINN